MLKDYFRQGSTGHHSGGSPMSRSLTPKPMRASFAWGTQSKVAVRGSGSWRTFAWIGDCAVVRWRAAGGPMAESRNENLLGQALSQLSDDLRRWLYVLVLCLVSVLSFLYLAQASCVAKHIAEMETLDNDVRELKKGEQRCSSPNRTV